MTNAGVGATDGTVTGAATVADGDGAGAGVAEELGEADADGVADVDADAVEDADAVQEAAGDALVEAVDVGELVAATPSAPWAGVPSRLRVRPVATAAVVAPSALRPIRLSRNIGQ